MLLVQAGATDIPSGFRTMSSMPVVQMILEQPIAPVADARIVPLHWQDAEEMLALATLTKPGPFTLKSQALGDFWGIRNDGRLIAMAGERLRQPGFTEVSGVCVHPDFRGHGLARLLSRFVAHRIQAAGEKPYLHTYATNATAIRLYETIGFRHRADLTATMIAAAE